MCDGVAGPQMLEEFTEQQERKNAMSKPNGKVFATCANIVALMAAMCVGAACHAMWQERKSARSSAEAGDGQMGQQPSSNHLVRMSIPWGRSEFDYPDDECEQQELDEKFMESLLTACGFEYTPSYEMNESRCFIVKGLKSWVLVNHGIIQCKGTPDGVIPENRLQMAKDLIARLNAAAPSTIRYRIHDDMLWCESTLPVEVLRRVASLDEQRETLRLLSAIPNEAIKRHKSEFDKILTRGE